MATDTVFGTTLLAEGTTQAEFLVNEMLARIIAGAIKVNSYGDTTPPGSPANFDSYILGAGPTGAWSGQAAKIAIYIDGWKFMTPTEGMQVRVNDVDIVIEYTGAAWKGVAGHQTLTDGATINWDTIQGPAAIVTIGASRTMAAPTGLVLGRRYTLQVVQGGAGSFTITWNAAFKWPGGTAPTLSTTPGDIDVIEFVCGVADTLYGKLYGADFS